MQGKFSNISSKIIFGLVFVFHNQKYFQCKLLTEALTSFIINIPSFTEKFEYIHLVYVQDSLGLTASDYASFIWSSDQTR